MPNYYVELCKGQTSKCPPHGLGREGKSRTDRHQDVYRLFSLEVLKIGIADSGDS